MNPAVSVQAKAFAGDAKVAPSSQAVSACQSRENEVLQLSYLIDHATLQSCPLITSLTLQP